MATIYTVCDRRRRYAYRTFEQALRNAAELARYSHKSVEIVVKLETSLRPSKRLDLVGQLNGGLALSRGCNSAGELLRGEGEIRARLIGLRDKPMDQGTLDAQFPPTFFPGEFYRP